MPELFTEEDVKNIYKTITQPISPPPILTKAINFLTRKKLKQLKQLRL